MAAAVWGWAEAAAVLVEVAWAAVAGWAAAVVGAVVEGGAAAVAWAAKASWAAVGWGWAAEVAGGASPRGCGYYHSPLQTRCH